LNVDELSHLDLCTGKGERHWPMGEGSPGYLNPMFGISMKGKGGDSYEGLTTNGIGHFLSAGPRAGKPR